MAGLLNELEHLAARQAACEALLTQVVVPLLVAFSPEMARELVQEIRAGFDVRTPVQNERLQLITEEYLARLADTVEARIRKNTGSRLQP